MAKFGVNVGNRISKILRPKFFTIKGWGFNNPEIIDITSQCQININVNIFTGEERLYPPAIFDSVPSGSVPIISSAISFEVNPTVDMRLINIDHEAIVQTPIIQHPLQDFDFSVEVIDEFNLTISPDVKFLEYAFFYDTQFIIDLKISDNIFSPIKINKILGMNYADKHWQVTKLVDNERNNKGNIRQNLNGNKEFNPKSKRQGRPPKVDINQPSIWDLIYVVLQPPLTLTETDILFLPHKPFPYQCKGIDFLRNNDHALLADDMGTGKTVMTIMALKILFQQTKIHHALILCPSSVLHEWRRHLEEWASELVVFFVRGGQDTRELIWETPFHVYVTTYDTLARDLGSGRLPPHMYNFFDVVILDEAHHIKNPNSHRSRAIKKLVPTKRWALTGTPIQNKLEDLASIFNFVYPSYLSSYDLYTDRIKEKIEPHFLRRKKMDVIDDLPEKSRQEFWLELDPDQRKIYNQVENGIISEIEALGNKVIPYNIIAKIPILKQICNFTPGKLSGRKLELLKEHVIEDVIGKGNKVIIFSQFIERGVNKLEEVFRQYKPAIIKGGQLDAIRSREIDRFKTQPDVSILIASIKAGGEGLNLAEATYVVHFDHWWNPATMWQAEDRVHRRGQTKGVNVYSYWMKDTIDERIYNILKRKGLLFENVIDGMSEQQIDNSLTLDDWLAIIGVNKVITPEKPIVDSKIWQSMNFTEIRDKLYQITPKEFEELIKELMHYLGYPNVKVTGKTGDGGIDVISTRTTTDGIERVAAQCKRYKGNVGVSVARDFLGAIYANNSIVKGFLITTGEFSSDCLQFCEKSGKIRAMSGLEVAKYVKQFGLRA